MSVLTRYLVKRNTFLLLAIMGAGVAIYLLTDFFERGDNLLDAGLGAGQIVMYFVFKLPSIIAQILPAVFLLALVVQFCLMAKSHELMALEAGGVSPLVLLRFVIIYGLVWSFIQLGLAQGLGVLTIRDAQRIWQEDVQKKSPDKPLAGLWFTESPYAVHMGQVFPASRKGSELQIYRLSPDGMRIDEIIQAKNFVIVGQGPGRHWLLQDGNIVNTSTFSHTTFDEHILHLRQDLSAFADTRLYGTKGDFLSLQALKSAIKQLERAGSNVEGLRTNFHARIAYAASLLVMAVFGLCIVMWSSNLYAASCLSLLVTFAFYALSTFCNTLGEKGAMSPPLAAWLANIVFFCLPLPLLLHRFVLRRGQS